MQLYSLALLALLAPAAQDSPPPALDDLILKARRFDENRDRASARDAWDLAWAEAQTAPFEDPRRYEILKRLVSAETALQRHAEAEEHLQLALHWVEKNSGPEDRRFLDDLTLLAYLCKARNDHTRGITILNRVLSLTVRKHTFESIEVAEVLSRMADFELARKELPRAEGVLWTAVSTRRKKLGEEHPSLIPDLEKLGGVLNMNRKYADAETAFLSAIGLRESALCPEIDLVNALDGLAYAQFGQQKFEAAERSYKRLLAAWVATATPLHPMVAATLDKMVVFYRKWGRAGEAASAWKSAVAIRSHALSETLSREAGERIASGDTREALRLYKQARSLLDPADPLHAELARNLDRALLDAGAPSGRQTRKASAKTPPKKSE